MFRPLPSFFQQFDKWLIYFYHSVSNGLVLVLQWLITERSHKEDLADSSATNIYHTDTMLWLSVALLKCLHWTKVVFQASKMAWKNIARCRGGADSLENPLHLQKWNHHFQSCGISPAGWRVWCQHQLNSVRSGWPLHQMSVIQAGWWSQEHAASRRAVCSCGGQLSCSQRCLTDVTCRNRAFHANSPEVP